MLARSVRKRGGPGAGDGSEVDRGGVQVEKDSLSQGPPKDQKVSEVHGLEASEHAFTVCLTDVSFNVVPGVTAVPGWRVRPAAHP